MLNNFLIVFGKIISKIFRLLKLGDGSTWPGHIALNLNKNFVKQVLQNSKTKIVIIAGTNGKTTTAALLKTALKNNGETVFQNKSGANLLNGIASSLIINSSLSGKIDYDFAIFEIDENALPHVLAQCEPDYLILINLFRDQLDRYGEINTIIEKWKKSISQLTNKTNLVLNADDPQIAYLSKGTDANVSFFGLSKSETNNNIFQDSADSGYCPNCSNKLFYSQIFFSHLGDWHCNNCGLTHPKVEINNFSTFPLPGMYNQYNTLACVLVLREIGIKDSEIEKSFANFKPAFGRQEIVKYKNKNVQIFLSKNPTSFNQSFKTISDLDAETLLIVLNDKIPDGRDISWIWDVDLPQIEKFKQILISGDRVYDMALRMKYELGIKNYESRVKLYEDLMQAIDTGVDIIENNETLFILPTYSAMLETRKILTGKKIL
ncbi:MAG TPA: MurT ligase domain-containing protein [Candidatus Saccharimonadales bacterium]|nr:MurT ligase domain-containing protein [Candidatus Saccharimonadales bacterium]